MKTCPKCGESKPLTEFGINRSKPDGLQSQCKVCKKETNRSYYLANPRRDERRAGSDRLKAKNREIVREALSAGCVDCGNTDFRVLEFDHVRGTKIANVTKMVYNSTAALIEEIAKCEVRCANCHKIATQERAQSWRTKPLKH